MDTREAQKNKKIKKEGDKRGETKEKVVQGLGGMIWPRGWPQNLIRRGVALERAHVPSGRVFVTEPTTPIVSTG